MKFAQHGSAAFLAWVLTFALASAAPISASAKDATFDSDGVKIHYIEEGEGEPVLLIHGYNASARVNWGVTGVIAALSPHYHVIALDNRGHGLSDKPVKSEEYGVKMVDDAIRLLDHLKIDKVNVVGYSMGGMITGKLLTMHPERIKSAVIGGMGWFHTRFGGELVESFPERDLTPSQACRRGFLQMNVSEEELKAIKVPMAVIVGENDALKPRYVDPFIKVRPDVPVTIIPGATHTTAVMRPEFKKAILSDLDRFTGRKP